MAAVLAIDGSVLSHSSAAAAWDLTGFDLEPLHLTCVRHSSLRDPRISLHRTKILDRVDVTTRGGLPATTAHSTLLDLAGLLDRDRLARVVDEAVLRRRTTLRWIRKTVDQLGGSGRPGTRLLRDVLAERSDDAVPASKLERKFIALVKRNGLPSPIKQFRLRLPCGRLRRYDFVYPAHRIAIETDGYRFHRFKADWQRDLDDVNQLFEIDWRLLRFSWADLSERPDHVIDTVRKALSDSDPQLRL